MFRRILISCTFLESVSQEETIDTHIGHIWRPRIFGLQYYEAKTLGALRKEGPGASGLKLTGEPFGVHPHRLPSEASGFEDFFEIGGTLLKSQIG